MKGIKSPKIYYKKLTIKKVNFISIFFVVCFLFFSTPDVASAGLLSGLGDILQSVLLSFGVSLIGVVFWIANFIGIALMIAASFILQNIMYLVLSWDYLPSNNEAVGTIWLLVRDLANMALIFILLYIGIGTILNLKVPGGNKSVSTLLIPFFISAILIHFTPLIAGIVIDISHIFTKYFFVASQDGVGSFGSTHPFSDQWNPFVWVSSMEDAAAIVIQSLMSIIYSLSVATVLLLTTILLIVRIVALNILVAISPIAFLSRIVPSLNNSIYEQWKKQFVQWALLPVILGLFLWMSVVVLQNSDNAVCDKIDNAVVVDGVNVFGNKALCTSIGSMMAVMILLIGLFVSSQTSAAGAGAIIRTGNRLAASGLRRGASRGLAFQGGALQGVGNRLYKFGTNTEQRLSRFGEGRNRFLKYGARATGFVAGGLAGGGVGTALSATGGVLKGAPTEAGRLGKYINYDKNKGLQFDAKGYKDDAGNALEGTKGRVGDARDALMLRPGVGGKVDKVGNAFRRAGAQDVSNRMQDLTNRDKIFERSMRRDTARIENERQEIAEWSNDNMLDLLQTKPNRIVDKERHSRLVTAIMERASNEPELADKIQQENIKGNISESVLFNAEEIADREGYGIQNDNLKFKGTSVTSMLDSTIDMSSEERRASLNKDDRVLQEAQDKYSKAKIKEHQQEYKEFDNTELRSVFSSAKTDQERVAAASRMSMGAMQDLASNTDPTTMERLIQTSSGLDVKTPTTKGQGRFNVAEMASKALVDTHNSNINIPQKIRDNAVAYEITQNRSNRIKTQNYSKEQLEYQVRNGNKVQDKVGALETLVTHHDLDKATKMFNSNQIGEQDRKEVLEYINNQQSSFGPASTGKRQKGGFTGQQFAEVLTKGTQDSKKAIMTGMLPSLLKQAENWNDEKVINMAQNGNIAQKSAAFTQIDDRELHDSKIKISIEEAQKVKEIVQGQNIDTSVPHGELMDAFVEGNSKEYSQARTKARERNLDEYVKMYTDKRGNLNKPNEIKDIITGQLDSSDRVKVDAIATSVAKDRNIFDSVLPSDLDGYDGLVASVVGFGGFENIGKYQNVQKVLYDNLQNINLVQHTKSIQDEVDLANQYTRRWNGASSDHDKITIRGRIAAEKSRLSIIYIDAEKEYKRSHKMRDKVIMDRAKEVMEEFDKYMPSMS